MTAASVVLAMFRIHPVHVVFFVLLIGFDGVRASRFTTSGPVLTVTLKDPDADGQQATKWSDLGTLRPNAVWGIQSRSPFPKSLPSLTSLRTSVFYNYLDQPTLPSSIEADLRLVQGDLDLQLQPSHHFKSRKTSLLVQATNGNSLSFLGRLSNKSKSIFEHIKASIVVNLNLESVSAVKITPTVDLVRQVPSCLLEGITGSGRTKAVLNLNYQEPTLTVMHALNRRHTIAPEISLQTAKILYSWNVNLESGAIKTVVDPTSAVHVTWTDRSMNGRWVTDFKLPLKGTSLSQVASSTRVRRQFNF